MMTSYQPPPPQYFIPTQQQQVMQGQPLQTSRNVVVPNPNFQQYKNHHHQQQQYYNNYYPQQPQHFQQQTTPPQAQANVQVPQKQVLPPNNYQTPYQSSNSTVRYQTLARPVQQGLPNYQTPQSSHSYYYPNVETNFQHQPNIPTTSHNQPFSSSTTYTAVGGIRTTPNFLSSNSYNPSQQYGYTSSSTVVNRITRNNNEDHFATQRSLSQLSRIRSQFTKPVNKPAENEKDVADAINKAFRQQFSSITQSSNNMKFPTQTAKLLKHMKADESKSIASSQPMFSQSTQTSIIQSSQPTFTGSQYCQTEHFVEPIKTVQIPPTHQSQMVQPTSLRGNISSDDRLMPPPSNFGNTTMNSSRISTSFHSSNIATPPMHSPARQSNISQISPQRTSSNPPVVLSNSFNMSTPKAHISDQQQQPVLDPCSQLSPSIGPSSQIHNTPPTYHHHVNQNISAQINTSSIEQAWNTPLVKVVPLIISAPPTTSNTNNSGIFMHNHPHSDAQNDISVAHCFPPPPQYCVPPSQYYASDQMPVNVTNEALIQKFPPQYPEPVNVTNEELIPNHLQPHDISHQHNLEEEKIRQNSIIEDINKSKALSPEGKEVTVVSDSKSESEETHEDGESNTMESSNKSEIENNEISKTEFEKAIREALRKARGFVHDIRENNTVLLSCKRTREFYEFSDRKNWKNRVTKTRPSIFHRRKYNLKSVSKTNGGDIVQVIEERLKKPIEMSPAKTTSTTPNSKSNTTPKSTMISKKQTPDLNILSTPLISPIPKNVYSHKLNIVPSESDIHEDFYLMKKLTSVKNLYADEDEWTNYEFITNNSQPSHSEFSGLINEFM